MKIKLHSIARQKDDTLFMEELFAGAVTVDNGLKGDKSAHCAKGEVIVLSKESWIKVCHETEIELPWLAHGANLLLKGFEFLPTDLGKSIRIGEVVLEIARESDGNQTLENEAPKIHEALKWGWRGGVVCKVLRSGDIQSGDNVDIIG